MNGSTNAPIKRPTDGPINGPLDGSTFHFPSKMFNMEYAVRENSWIISSFFKLTFLKQSNLIFSLERKTNLKSGYRRSRKLMFQIRRHNLICGKRKITFSFKRHVLNSNKIFFYSFAEWNSKKSNRPSLVIRVLPCVASSLLSTHLYNLIEQDRIWSVICLLWLDSLMS